MPAVPADPLCRDGWPPLPAGYDDIRAAGDELLKVLTLAEVLVTRTDHHPGGPAPGGGPAESGWPGNTQAANVVMDAHAGVRALEREMRVAVSGTIITRGGSDANTAIAVAQIAAMSIAAGDEHRALAMRLIHGWTVAGQRLPAVDEAARWVRIRLVTRCPACRAKLPPPPQRCSECGELPPLPPACPYCKTYNLRLAEGAYVVACFHPDCPERKDGRRPQARLDLSALPPHEPVLRWQDGIIQAA